MTTDWANEPAPGTMGAPAAGAPVPVAAAAGGAAYTVQDDWSAAPVQQSDWAAESAQAAAPAAAPAAPAAADPTAQWGGSTNWN